MGLAFVQQRHAQCQIHQRLVGIDWAEGSKNRSSKAATSSTFPVTASTAHTPMLPQNPAPSLSHGTPSANGRTASVMMPCVTPITIAGWVECWVSLF